jgi:hypothetical protein
MFVRLLSFCEPCPFSCERPHSLTRMVDSLPTMCRRHGLAESYEQRPAGSGGNSLIIPRKLSPPFSFEFPKFLLEAHIFPNRSMSNSPITNRATRNVNNWRKKDHCSTPFSAPNALRPHALPLARSSKKSPALNQLLEACMSHCAQGVLFRQRHKHLGV